MRNFIILTLMSFLMVSNAFSFESDTISDYMRGHYEREAVADWVVERTKNKISRTNAKDIVDTVYAQSEKTGVDPLIVIGMISKESMFRKTAKSGYGAAGLMQVVPRWHQDKIKKRNIYNRSVNIEVGVKVLYDCLRARKTVPGAMNCYSGGAKGYSKYVQARHKELKTAIVLSLFENNQKINVAYNYSKPITERPVLYAGL